MKRSITGFVVALLFVLAPIAEARIGVCVTWYGDDGEKCREECEYYNNEGEWTGSVTVDYHC